MRVNETKRRLLQGKPVIGIGASLGSPLAAEVLSLAGYDFVLVDNQHGAWDDQSTQAAFRSIALGAATPMVRVQKNDFAVIGRVLDRGALGIIVPMVNSAEEARAAAYAVRYPPEGGRSIGPFGTAFLGDDYVQQINQEVYLAVQIESRQAVERAEEILSVEGVDGCWIGPGDLANSMGVDWDVPEDRGAHEAAILKVLEVCRRVGKIPGIAASWQNAQYWFDKGFLFVTVGGDGGLLQSKATEVLASLKGEP